ncbi:MAG: type 4a pilus biogenesis protein PilO [Desulfosarcina sp.]|nr:type 4a pilus biogenesis protein PilO [Desulfobacterales bacterium]
MPWSWSQFSDLLKANKRFWLVCAGLIVVNLIFYLFFVAGEFEQINQLQKSYQTRRQDLTEMRKLQLRAENYAESQKAWKAFLDRIENKINFPDRIEELTALFHRHNLDPGGLTFKSEKVAGLPLVRFVSAIETSGRYADLKTLLSGIQQLPGLFCIERLDIDKNRKASTLVLKMELAAYFNDPRPGP